ACPYNTGQIAGTQPIGFGNKRHTVSFEGGPPFSKNGHGFSCVCPSLDRATRQRNETLILHMNAVSLSSDISVNEGCFTTATVHDKAGGIAGVDRTSV